MSADIVRSYHFAKAIPKVQLLGQPQVNTNVRPEYRPIRPENCRRQNRRAPRSNHVIFGAGQVDYSSSGTEIRAYAAASSPEIQQKIEYECLLGTCSCLLIERI